MIELVLSLLDPCSERPTGEAGWHAPSQNGKSVSHRGCWTSAILDSLNVRLRKRNRREKFVELTVHVWMTTMTTSTLRAPKNELALKLVLLLQNVLRLCQYRALWWRRP